MKLPDAHSGVKFGAFLKNGQKKQAVPPILTRHGLEVRRDFSVITTSQDERMNRVFVNGDEISGPALAELIDECKAAVGAFLTKQKDSGAISPEQKNTIREMLELTEGKTEVAVMGLTEEIDWLIELRDKVEDSGITVADLTQN